MKKKGRLHALTNARIAGECDEMKKKSELHALTNLLTGGGVR